jgi:hypothetical protein
MNADEIVIHRVEVTDLAVSAQTRLLPSRYVDNRLGKLVGVPRALGVIGPPPERRPRPA